MTTIISKIVNKENDFYAFLYSVISFVKNFSIPSLKFIHLPLFYLQKYLSITIRKIINAVWYIPLFMARCTKCGKNLRLYGMSFVRDDNLELYIGDNVSIEKSSFLSNPYISGAKITVGNNVHINKDVVLTAHSHISIGDECMIAKGCFISDTNSHPIEPNRRKEFVDVKEAKPIIIGKNVWLGVNCIVLKGVTIGDNCLIAAGSIIRKDIPANSIVMGPNARHMPLENVLKGE